MNKILICALYFLIILIGGCSAEQAEEFAFRKTMEYQLKEDCGDDKACLKAIEDQIKHCMEESNWRSYLENEEDPVKLQQFIEEFFPCFKDPAGGSYFNY